ncbi:MAG: DoxX family protein [Flavobacteriaceae bacterium]
MTLTLLTLFSGISFLFFGISCLISERLKEEFIRYGLPHFRILTGTLQLLGALGLFIGFLLPVLQWLSSAGLALLMLLGFAVRLKIKDRFIQSFPALFYCLLNAYLCYALVQLNFNELL